MFNNIVNPQEDGVFMFWGTDGTNFIPFTFPSGYTMMNIICIGGGGGGGGGALITTATNCYGGTGGGAGAVTNVLGIPIATLPSTIYLLPGARGIGGTASATTTGNAGTAGGTSYVSVIPSTTVSLFFNGANANYNICILAYAGGGGGGAAGNTTAAGAAGTAGTAGSDGTIGGTINNWRMPLSFGRYSSVAGQAGGGTGLPPGTTIAGSDVTAMTGTIVSGGAGGAGCTSTASISGGAITGNGIIPTIPRGSTGANQHAGYDGVSFLRPLCSCGGSGGASTTVSTYDKGSGGNGGFGSGGGGGASAYGSGNAAKVGDGGNGGPGLIILTLY